ncbi:hypothetical protein [Crassaminicella indica]|uniref:Uncharacterized protein n=1 Tax=Crassaminicella indica TaxID=2855394 RepID=A0ABX8RDW2_9CLOT|nr:hypothetical protein [Crassaminicella indica]QXM06956.1 hypothetical protein KVH43_04350 [Crassaminicella indica]
MSEKILYALYELIYSKTPSDVYSGWTSILGDYSEYSIQTCLDEGTNILLNDKLQKILNREATYFEPYFQSSNFYFLSKSVFEEMKNAGLGSYTFTIDHSVSFDSNFTRYINDFLNDSSKVTTDYRFYNTIDILLKEDINYDYYFYLLENYENVYLAKGKDKKTREDDIGKFYKNLVNLELFKSIDKNIYKSTGKIEFTISESEAYIFADEIINGFYNSHRGKEVLESTIVQKKILMVMIIGMLIVGMKSKKSAKNKMPDFIKYCYDEIGIFYERESRIAFDYFENKGHYQIFKYIQRGKSHPQLKKEISNIAWDFQATRVMERFIIDNDKAEFSIPVFLTFDENLRKVLGKFKAKGVVINKKESSIVPYTNSSSIDFFNKKGCSTVLDIFQDPNNKKERVMRFNENKKKIDKIIDEKICELYSIINRA